MSAFSPFSTEEMKSDNPNPKKINSRCPYEFSGLSQTNPAGSGDFIDRETASLQNQIRHPERRIDALPVCIAAIRHPSDLPFRATYAN